MDKMSLVTPVDFAVGGNLLQILDRSGLGISLALWLHTPEYEDWRFVLASRILDRSEPSEAYGLVHDALGEAGMKLENTPPLLILGMTDPVVRALRRTFGKAQGVEGMRLGGQMIGDRFVDDAIVYRVR